MRRPRDGRLGWLPDLHHARHDGALAGRRSHHADITREVECRDMVALGLAPGPPIGYSAPIAMADSSIANADLICTRLTTTFRWVRTILGRPVVPLEYRSRNQAFTRRCAFSGSSRLNRHRSTHPLRGPAATSTAALTLFCTALHAPACQGRVPRIGCSTIWRLATPDARSLRRLRCPGHDPWN